MTYSTIRPPFTLDFDEMSKKDLIAYAAWFHDVTPTRIAELTKAVTSTPGYEGWRPSATLESLDELGRWFEGQVETRPLDDEEIAKTHEMMGFAIDTSEGQLTNRTFSLAMDIGMYFAQVVLKNLPGTRWDQPLRNKKFADYGQPVLMGFGTVPLNPVRVIVNTAYAVSTKRAAQLRRLFDTWAKMRK